MARELPIDRIDYDLGLIRVVRDGIPLRGYNRLLQIERNSCSRHANLVV